MEKYKELIIDMTLTPEIILEQLAQQQTYKVEPIQNQKASDGESAETKK